MKLSIDNNAPISFKEFLKINSDTDVTPLSKEEILDIKKLKIGESLFVEITEIKRVS